MGLIVSLLAEGACCLSCLACSSLRHVIPARLAAPRVLHLLIGTSVWVTAQLLGSDWVLNKLNTAHRYGHFKGLQWAHGCSSGYLQQCQVSQLGYRASLSMVIYFAATGLLSTALPSVYSRFWGLKALLAFGVLAGFLYTPNDVFTAYSEVARVLSLLWMLFQSFLVVDCAHVLHEFLTQLAEREDYQVGAVRAGEVRFSSRWRVLYLALSAGAIAAGLAVLMHMYSGAGTCRLGSVLINGTLVGGICGIAVSLLDALGVGLLPPSIIFAYSAFQCYYTLDGQAPCHSDMIMAATESSSSIGTWTPSAVAMGTILAGCVGWCVCSRDRLLESFSLDDGTQPYNVPSPTQPTHLTSLISGDTQGETGLDDGALESPASSSFFLAAMALASMFAAMVVTNWGSPSGLGIEDASERLRSETLWIKGLSELFTLVLQWRILWVTYHADNGFVSF